MKTALPPRAPRIAAGLCLATLALVFAGLAPGVCHAQADEPVGVTIADVRFVGLENLKAEDLLERIQSRAGTTYDMRRVRADLKNLAALAYEAEVRRVTTGEGLRLIFVIRENPTLDEIRILGNEKVSTDRLRKLVGVAPGEVLTRSALREARTRIMREYRSAGFAEARVEVELARTPEGGEILQVLVDEGRKIRVEDLLIEGNAFYSDLRLRTSVETRGSWFFLKNYFDETAFEEDLRTIRTLYEKAGFFTVRVERGPFEFDESGPALTPVIVVREGPRYRFGTARPRGNTVFRSEEIVAAFEPMRGEMFDAEAYTRALDKVRALYGNAGFVTVDVAEELQLDEEAGTVDVDLVIDEGARARVGDIRVERRDYPTDAEPSFFNRIYGNIAPPVENDVILREVTLSPGEVYEKRAEEESEERLRRLGVFESVEVESRATADPGTRDVLVKVEEGVTGNVFVGVGYSESFGVYAFGRYVERNFLGQAGDLRLDIMAGTEQISSRISYLDRYLGESDNSLYTEIHHINAYRPGYDERNTGLGVELGMPIDEHWKTYVGTRLEYVSLDEGSYNPDEDFNVDYPVAALSLRFAHDVRRTERILGTIPQVTGGHLGSIGFEGGYADGPLAKLIGRYEWYAKVTERMVFATDATAGFMPVDADDIGPTERFYLGGTHDLRGFKFRRAGPHDRGDNDVPLGGATKLLVRNELRYPLIDGLSGLVFVDGGMLEHDALDFGTPRASSGLGLRLALKGVEVGVDFAYPFAKQRDDDPRYVHFFMSTLKGF